MQNEDTGSETKKSGALSWWKWGLLSFLLGGLCWPIALFTGLLILFQLNLELPLANALSIIITALIPIALIFGFALALKKGRPSVNMAIAASLIVIAAFMLGFALAYNFKLFGAGNPINFI